jgi:putative membrane protein
MKLYPKNRIPVREIKKFIVIFYIVGFLGFMIPFTKNIFILITPFAILLSMYLLGLYHTSYSGKNIVLFLLVVLSGFFIEVVGVKTGLIFGNYHYGKALGIKLCETPLLIGINWLFLTYTGTSIIRSFKIKPVFIILLAPLLIVVYDIVLEQVAPKTCMWFWENSTVPLKNYIAWYLIGVIFVSFFQIFNIKTENTMAKILFISQFLFFVMLVLFLK